MQNYIYYICGRKILKKFARDKNYQKVRDHCHYTAKYRGIAHSICNLKFNVPNEIPLVFLNPTHFFMIFPPNSSFINPITFSFFL